MAIPTPGDGMLNPTTQQRKLKCDTLATFDGLAAYSNYWGFPGRISKTGRFLIYLAQSALLVGRMTLINRSYIRDFFAKVRMSVNVCSRRNLPFSYASSNKSCCLFKLLSAMGCIV